MMWQSVHLVSIHAPVKVRLSIKTIFGGYKMFQFTHLWRCDVHGQRRRDNRQGFNSRTCEGATPDDDFIDTVNGVSIHAPVKVRRSLPGCTIQYCWFQFTHLWRCDMEKLEVLAQADSFNSRTCEGATISYWDNLSFLSVSIHAPVKVRRAGFFVTIFRNKFQFTHLWRCDNLCKSFSYCKRVSIHAPVKVRPPYKWHSFRYFSFNSRTCEGATV